MKTPICDFVKDYCKNNAARLHMPGHKGKDMLGFENADITEIVGADSLFEANGIIAESERNASTLFGANTFYSTEGCSHCIRAMLYLLKLQEKKPLIFAGRNAHKSFLSAAALLDLEVEWIPSEDTNYLSGKINLNQLEHELSDVRDRFKAVYITSPDYLGNISDVKAISEICKRQNAVLCVDNAHGAYLKFLSESCHPIDLGADMCCDSAHKTLPVLTGGAYLHVSKNTSYDFSGNAKNALSVFGSTSPSYLILQSLDKANEYVYNGYKERLAEFISLVETAKQTLCSQGFVLSGNEKLKIVISAKEYGYYGFELADELLKRNVVCEFSDRDFTVLMLTPENGKSDIDLLVNALKAIEKKEKINEIPPKSQPRKRLMTLRKALFAESENIDASKSEGRILSQFNISCPPAVPIAVCGEVIDKTAVDAFRYYGIEHISVVK